MADLNLVARVVDKTKQGLSGVGKNIDNATKSTGKLKKAGKAAGLAVAGIGAAAVGIGGKVVKDLLATGDALDKMSKRTGVGVEELQKLGFAAEQSGSDLATVEKALLKQAKAIEAPTKAAEEAFEALGLSVDELKGKSPEEQFKIISEAMSGIEDPAEKARLAQDLFGKSGAQLIPLMDEGADGIAALGSQFEDTGNIMSENTAQSAAQFNDSMNILKNQGMAAGQEAFAALAPVMATAAEKFSELPMGAKATIAGMTALAPVLASAGSAIRGLTGITQGLAAAKKVVVGLLNKEKIAQVAKTVATVAGTAAQKAATAGQWLLNAALTANPIGLVIAALVALGAAVVVAYNKSEKFREIVTNAWNKIKEVWDTVSSIFKPAFEAFWDGIKVVFQTAWDLISGYFKTVIGIIQDVFRIFKSVFTGDWRGVWDGIKNLFSNAWNNIFGIFTTTINNILSKFGFGRDALARIWDNISSKVSSVWDGITGMIKGAINGIIGFINKLVNAWNGLKFKIPEIKLPKIKLPFGKSIDAGTFGGQSFSFPKLPTIPRLAEGGIVTSPTLALIGEKGPEAIVPLDRGRGTPQPLTVILNLDGVELGQAIVSNVNEASRRGELLLQGNFTQ